MNCPNCGGTDFRTIEVAYATGYASTAGGWLELWDVKDHDYETESIYCETAGCGWEHTLADGETADDALADSQPTT